MQRITAFFTELMRWHVRDPFVFVVGLALLMMLALLVSLTDWLFVVFD